MPRTPFATRAALLLALASGVYAPHQARAERVSRRFARHQHDVEAAARARDRHRLVRQRQFGVAQPVDEHARRVDRRAGDKIYPAGTDYALTFNNVKYQQGIVASLQENPLTLLFNSQEIGRAHV